MLKKLILIFIIVAVAVNVHTNECNSDLEGLSKDCLLPMDRGECEALIPRWFFNKTSCQCELFKYGGCGGNGNRFDLEGDCHCSCIKPCEQPPLTGNCRAYIKRWFHNATVDQCQEFIYGGCGGNNNNFISEKECKEKCSKSDSSK